jgi:hypothetical protein
MVRPAAAATTLYRTVLLAELTSIQRIGAFSNIPGIETKYFSTTLRGARPYAAQAARVFGDGPFTFVRTIIPTNRITPEMHITVDRGIRTVTISTGLLGRLSAPDVVP